MCSMGLNPAQKRVVLHWAHVSSIPPSTAVMLGLESRAVGDPHFAWLLVWSLLLPNPHVEAPFLTAKPLEMGLGKALPPLQGSGEGDACFPSHLPGMLVAVGGSGDDVCPSILSSLFWSLLGKPAAGSGPSNGVESLSGCL